MVERSRSEKANDTIEREREEEGEWRRKRRGVCERSVPPGLWPSVCFCGYLPPHCLLAESGDGGGLVRVRL